MAVLATVWAEAGTLLPSRYSMGIEESRPLLGETLEGADESSGSSMEFLDSILKPYPTCGGYPAATNVRSRSTTCPASKPDAVKSITVDLAPQTIIGAAYRVRSARTAGRLSAAYVVAWCCARAMYVRRVHGRGCAPRHA